MGKVTWDKDQHQKAKQMQLPLISIAYDGGPLPKDRDGRHKIVIDGPCPAKFVDQFRGFIRKLCDAMAAEDREVSKAPKSRKAPPANA